MKLIVRCPLCKNEMNAPNHSDNRIDYAKQFGDTFTLTCSACHKDTEYHVDKIRAVDYSFAEIIINRMVIFAVLFIVSAIFGYYLSGFAGAVGLSILSTGIYLWFAKRNNSGKNLDFNRHKLKGRVAETSLKR
ncbi:hypothetical protein [Galbibacter sp. PAP.153]|uniref:hypothetical protein n=1 Tax=Galbibacter sp. PAP.153 TaxID=3104623 RepID=UPI00300968DC